MMYYWLVPLIVLALVAVFLFASAGRRKSNSASLNEGESPEAIKRGKYINK